LNIEKCLREYREKTARIAILALGISGLRDEINYSTGIIETDDETIEGMTFRRSEGGDGSNEISSKTERVALKFRYEQDKLGKPVSVSSLYDEIRRREGELNRLKDEIGPMKLALDGLTTRERFIIDEHYIDGLTWREVIERWKTAFDYYPSERKCKEVSCKAFVKLKRMLSESIECTDSARILHG